MLTVSEGSAPTICRRHHFRAGSPPSLALAVCHGGLLDESVGDRDVPFVLSSLHMFFGLWPVGSFCFNHHPLHEETSLVRSKSSTDL